MKYLLLYLEAVNCTRSNAVFFLVYDHTDDSSRCDENNCGTAAFLKRLTDRSVRGYDFDRKYDSLQIVILDSVGNFNRLSGSQNVSDDVKMKHPGLFETIKEGDFKGDFLVGSGNTTKDKAFGKFYKRSLETAGKHSVICIGGIEPDTLISHIALVSLTLPEIIHSFKKFVTTKNFRPSSNFII